jgi:hypothetical protein
MPYAPTVNDNSGQILAQGINQGIGSLAEGIQRSIAERKKKEEDRKAKEAVNAAGKGLFGEDFDVKDAKPEQYGQLIQMAQAKRDEPMREAERRFKQAQIDNFALQAQLQQSEAARRQSDDAAFRAVYGGQGSGGPSVGLTENQTGMTGTQPVQGGATAADANDVVSRFARGGGSLAAGSQLANMERDRAGTMLAEAQATKALQPRDTGVSYLNPPADAKFIRDANGNIIAINPPKLDPKARREFTVGGKDMVEEAGMVFNAKTGELVGPPKPLDPNTQSLLASRLSAAQAIADEPQGYLEGKTTFEKRVRDAQLKANLAAGSLGVRLPYDPAEAPPGRVGAPSPAARPATSVAPTSYKSAEAVRTAYRQGDLTREAAAAILQKQFGLQ